MTNYEIIRMSIGKNNGENVRVKDLVVLKKLVETEKLTAKQREAIVRMLMDYYYAHD